MERLFLESTVDLIPLFSVKETRSNRDLAENQSRIKDIVSKIEKLRPVFSIPSLDIRNNFNHPEGNIKEPLHEAFSKKLSVPFECDSESVVDAPNKLLNNLSFTFLNLLNSRINNSIRAIMNHATLLDVEKNAIIDILSSSTTEIVSIVSMVTRFRALSFTDDASKTIGSAAIPHHQDNSFQIPIIFDFCMDLFLLSEVQITVKISITGSALSSIGDTKARHKHCKVSIELDTLSLLKSLVSEGHRVCKSLVAVASSSALSELGDRVSSPTNTSVTPSISNHDKKVRQETHAQKSLEHDDKNVSEKLQKDAMDMPPPSPRIKPTQGSNKSCN